MANQIVWCDIPVLDLERAIRFYSAVLGSQIKQEQLPGMTIGILPHNDGEVGGCLFKSSDDKPSDQGPMIYLNANGRHLYRDRTVTAWAASGGVSPTCPARSEATITLLFQWTRNLSTRYQKQKSDS
jgi:predicted enzyme related to lactoylglutathione lyase